MSIETTDESSEDLYDPSKALNSAILDWLPQFSISENCTTEIPLIIRGDNNLESMEIEVCEILNYLFDYLNFVRSTGNTAIVESELLP